MKPRPKKPKPYRPMVDPLGYVPIVVLIPPSAWADPRQSWANGLRDEVRRLEKWEADIFRRDKNRRQMYAPEGTPMWRLAKTGDNSEELGWCHNQLLPLRCKVDEIEAEVARWPLPPS